MLYEINALPWTYVAPQPKAPDDDGGDTAAASSPSVHSPRHSLRSGSLP